MIDRNRVLKGVSTAGQFAPESRTESSVALNSRAARISEAQRITELPDHERWMKVNGDTVRIDRVDDLAKEVVVREAEIDGSFRIPFEDMSAPDRAGALRSHPNINFADPGFANRHENELNNISDRALGPNSDFDSAPADVEAVIQWSRKQSRPLNVDNPRAMDVAIFALKNDYARDFGDDARMGAPDRHFQSLLRTVWEDEDCARYLAEK